MAISDLWSLATIRGACQRELMDPSARFWATAELDIYINAWQTELQEQFEFVYGSSTQVMTNSSTITLNTLSPSMLRLEAVYYNNRRLVGRSKQDLEDLSRTWVSSSNTDPEPLVVYQNDSRDLVLWPPVTGTGTVVMEYPVVTTFATGTSTMSIPAWTRYSATNYVAMRALLREGPANNTNKALRYKRKYERNKKMFRLMWDGYLPHRAPALRPADKYSERIIQPSRVAELSA